MTRLGIIGLAVGAFTVLGLSTGARAQGTIAYAPVIGNAPSGAMLNVTPVVSADRRYVRMSLQPTFTDFTEFDTFAVPGVVSNFGFGGGGGGFGGGGGGFPGAGGGFRSVGAGGTVGYGAGAPVYDPYAANPQMGLGAASDRAYISPEFAAAAVRTRAAQANANAVRPRATRPKTRRRGR